MLRSATRARAGRGRAYQVVFALMLALALRGVAAAQGQGTLHVSVTLLDADQKRLPVPGHGLLISDNPATSAPRRVVTGPDGRVDVRLKPGNYSVESDEPVAFGGRSYEWTLDVDVPQGGEATLVMTAANAGIGEPVAAPADSASGRRPSDPSMALQQWKPSVVALWTPTARVSGFLLDSRGLIATSQKALGDAPRVEVQLSPTLKVAGRVLVADATLDVAIVQVDASIVSTLRPLAPACAQATVPPVEGDELFALGVPLRTQQDTLSSGTVKRLDGQRVEADLRVPTGGVGGPVFSEAGELLGVSSLLPDPEARRRDFAVVPIRSVCDLVPRAERALAAGGGPTAAPLPVESAAPLQVSALKAVAATRQGDLAPYQLTSSDFDIAFITPVMIYAAQHPPADRRTTSRDTNRPLEDEVRESRQMEFANWTDYVSDNPPVLLVRVTPKMAEGFWRTFVRGAAMTQGIQLPPMKQAKARLSRLQAFCGDAEATPIHALTLQTPVSDTESFDEGLYAFAPGALGAGCSTVRLVLYAEKTPEKGDSRVVAPAVLARVARDFDDLTR